ncbi:MAG TPA: TMEM175 family protein [Solirubrobacterales bacterium]
MQEGLAPRRRYGRDSVEFARTLSFTDGLFAIAATLLVIDLAVPILHHESSVHELATKLNDEHQKFISFFISFAVIGRYWVAHHTYFSALSRIDRPLIGLNMVYLAFIALLPFPTALLGEYFSNPLSITIYAVNVAIISAMEVVLFGWAHDHDLLERKLPQDVYRFGVAMSLAPVIFFVISIPVAFLTTTTLAVCTWFLGIPLAAIAGRWKPEGADDLLLG